MDSHVTGESEQVDGGMVRGTEDSAEKKEKRLSRKKSKNRSRKKRSHSKVTSDGAAEPVEADDMKETSAGTLARQHSINSREQKTRSLSGSRKRLSGWFKRKSRSESRGRRSKSETELSNVDQNTGTKRHESAEDIKRGSRNYDNRGSTYEVYDITKQPRDRLRRMTVRDAEKERRRRLVASGYALSNLNKQVETEVVAEERTRTASLPDITSVDSPGDKTNEHKPDESKDVVDGASALVRGSVTLPREKKNRFGKKQKGLKSGRVSIEADSDDNIISDNAPQISARSQDDDQNISEKNGQAESESPQTQIEVMVHDIANLLERDKSTGQENTVDVKPHVEVQQDNVKKATSNIQAKDAGDISSNQNDANNGTEFSVSESERLLTLMEGIYNRNTKKTPTVAVSSVPPSKAISRWQNAIMDVQKKRRKKSLSLFLELSRSPNPHSSMSMSGGRDLSPGRLLDKTRSPSPRPKIDSMAKETGHESRKSLSPNQKPEETSIELSPVAEMPNDNENKTKNIKITLGVPHQIDRSLSDGEGKTVLDKTAKLTQKCHRSHSAVSEPSQETARHEYGYANGDRNGVPVMGTSVQKKYKRTFSPKRQESVPVPNHDKTTTDEGIDGDTCKQPEKKDHTQLSDSQKENKKEEEELQNTKREATKSPERADDTENNTDNTEMNKALENRGRESQKRRRKTGRSFRRKREVDEEVIEAKTTQESEAEVVKGEEMSPVRLMYDKCTQTSEIDLSEKSKLFGKSKKNNKKEKKEKEKEKKKLKDVASLVHDANKEEEKKLSKAEEPGNNKTVDNEREADNESEKQDSNKNSPEHETSPEITENEKNTPENDSKPKPKKLSFTTLVFLKQRIASRRNKKVLEEKKNISDQDPVKDMFLIENEINLSKLADIKETDILDDEIIEPDVSLDLPRKQLRFEPVASDEPIQGEEPLPPLARSRTKRLSSRRESTMREKRRKCLQCCKKATAFLFSHIGLCSLVVAYTIMGGFIFKAIEGPFENKVKTKIRETRIKMVDKMLQHATELSLSEIGHENFTAIVDQQLKDFQKTVFKETKDHGWDGKDKSDADIPEMQWSFASSLLYAITVMTTIGYGHVAPKTDTGRIVTIGYAVLGIPLTLLCLTNIGDVMATGFRLLYGKICCGVCCKLFQRRRRRRIPDLEKGLAHQVMASEEEEEDKPKEVIHVPTSLCILLIAGYIFAGALLFALWEKWDYLTGSYFCFITLSTIGFGDIVPGTDTWAQEEKLVLCAMYLVFGLSLIAMCFNLVQEDVKAKCRWLGMKMGIIDKPESSV
ncbi:uncharacterized protein [Haliotis cracherodii]|uniref:uncharacterized protein n=1 Tax=Haliotis cracherodii TaxID=6455 RepID=UPI0039E7B0EE